MAVDLRLRQMLLTLQWTPTLELGRPSCFTTLFGGVCFTPCGLLFYIYAELYKAEYLYLVFRNVYWLETLL
jgi:hypothetical protein